MKFASRIFAGLYAAIVLLAVLYALTTEIYMRNQEVEHLLPSFVLAFVTLPLSLTLDPIYSAAPSFLDGPFVQIAFLTVCGAVQASILWWWASAQVARSARQQAAGSDSHRRSAVARGTAAALAIEHDTCGSEV